VWASLYLAAAQPVCVPYDIEANAALHATTIRSAHARVVVFPELSLTGHHLDAAPVGVDDPSLRPIVDACAAAGSLALFGSDG
jgi:predicted amidohydrolase